MVQVLGAGRVVLGAEHVALRTKYSGRGWTVQLAAGERQAVESKPDVLLSRFVGKKHP
jgi:hypothetical protein